MRAVDKKIEKQVQFWSVLGPFFIFLTLFVTLVKLSPTNLYLACIALASIPICWKWKVYGIGMVIGAVTGVIAYSFGTDSSIDRFWNVGMGIALSIGCIVTTLSFEEVEHLIQSLQIESKSRLDNLWHLDEKIKMIQETQEAEKKNLLEMLDRSTQEMKLLRQHIQNKEQAEMVFKEKLATLEDEKLLLLEQVHQNRKLSDTFERDQREQKKNYQTMQALRQEQDLQLQRVIQENHKAQEAAHLLKQEVYAKEQTNHILEHELLSCRQLIESLQEKVAAIKESDHDNENVLGYMEKKLRQAEGKYRQLAVQFQEKSDVLHQTRKELFLVQESFAALQMEVDEQRLAASGEAEKELKEIMISFEKEMSSQALQHVQEIEELHGLVSSLLKPIPGQ